ncbi:hypothetical protein SAICODRAFT_32427 [Saitoella complicata NRRL Y-17804]|nr:uncharacterized protein SAICODRAFT_32427 [Saitoella complicata NRRL Y-17804]ODQ49602.1 hypothetical protein SAICODRAFT_32427 [Saitoella complicata NRRL Y-17804]
MFIGADGDEMDESTFLGIHRPEDCDTLNMTFEFMAELEDTNRVLNDASSPPTLKINRRWIEFRDPQSGKVVDGAAAMQKVCKNIYNELFGRAPDDEKPEEADVRKPVAADMGVVAHEVGTMRMDAPDPAEHPGVVDDNLQFRGFDNLYVCDLSVFPVSPPANPTLTLAALAMRLANRLHTLSQAYA